MTASSYFPDHHPRIQAQRPSTRPSSRSGTDVTDLDAVRVDRIAVERLRREAARIYGLMTLLQQRPDLEGVHAHADFATNYLRWCV